MKKEILILLVLILSASLVYALEPCQSGGLTTSVNKNYQMLYVNEDFIQINNIDSLKEVGQLKDLTCLQYMDATDRTIKGDIANLKNLKELVAFSLYSNPDVSGDICSLAGATKLRSLKFAFDPNITGDVSCLKSLTQLETFAMTHTQISGDISVFANMPNLKAIYISGTNIKGNICALSELTNLEELGISDEYPGNPDIYGDLSCLDNLKKLKRVSLYNMNTTNCEQFTKSHPNISEMGETESGRKAGGGCSEESMKTLVDVAQKYEAKIGKEVQTEVKGKPNYQPTSSEGETSSSNAKKEAPPEECIVDGKFIGEEKCRTLVDKGAGDKSQGPPKECIVDGEFIGKNQCKSLMEKDPGIQPFETEQSETAIKKSLFKRVVDWFGSLFK